MSLGLTETRSTCPYCGVGCGVIIESQQGQITDVRGDPEHPANFGRLCSKGQTLHLTVSASVTQQTRLLQPLQRLSRGETLQPVAWEAAMDGAARKLAGIVKQHGADAVGFYISGQLLTEDYYVFNKLVKGLLGTNQVDSNSRLCMSSAVAGYKATLGMDAPPACYEDLDHAGCVFIAGSNMAWAHPVLFRRLEEARQARPDQKWVVVDPRRTETAAAANLHLQLLPGTDIALFHGLLHVMLWEGWTNPAYIAAHTTGFEALRERVREFTPAMTATLTGCKAQDIVQAARWFATAGPTLSLYCQGLNQSHHGTDSNVALINLHLATGQIGFEGAGPLSLTGQPNAMGGRETGGMANLMSAHGDLANPAHRAAMASFWGVPDVCAQPGRTALEMFEAAAEGEVKALWIACTNPAHSLPHQALVKRALERCEFVVLQEAFAHTATAPYADLMLPATPWGEKSGTVTNSERRISRVRAALPPLGQARADWAIAQDLGQRLETLLPARTSGGAKLFGYRSPEAIWNEHRDSTQGRDLDITGLSYAALEQQPAQWPFPAGSTTGQARLYADGVFPTTDGRARFGAPAFRAVAEPRNVRYGFSLNTGRLRDQWHGMSRTGTVARLGGQAPEPAVYLHPQDMSRRAFKAGQLLRVKSSHGQCLLPVQPSDELLPTQAYVPMHWGPEFAGGLGVNALLGPARCATSKQPELKHAAVALEPAGLPWRMVAGLWLAADRALALRHQLQLRGADALGGGYCSATLFGREPAPQLGVWLRLERATAPSAEALQTWCEAFGLNTPQTLRYADAQRGLLRCLALEGGGAAPTLQAMLLAGDVRAEAWLSPLLRERSPLPISGTRLLMASETAPLPMPARSPQVCNCLDVSAAHIEQQLQTLPGDAAQRLEQLQARLACGTRCGSCLPALRAWVAKVPAPAEHTGPTAQAQNATV